MVLIVPCVYKQICGFHFLFFYNILADQYFIASIVVFTKGLTCNALDLCTHELVFSPLTNSRPKSHFFSRGCSAQ